MTTCHDLTAAQFSALASGMGGVATVRRLREAQLSKCLLLLRLLADSGTGTGNGGADALAVLSTAHDRARGAVADLLTEPLIGARLVHSVRAALGQETERRAHGLGRLGALAAVSALRSKLDVDMTVDATGHRVVLPTLGSARLPLPDSAPVRVVVNGGRIVIRGDGFTVAVPADAGTDTGSWWGLRRLTSGACGRSISVVLDDLDPHRDVHHAPAGGRLDGGQVASWRGLFGRAWALLSRYAPARADELAAGLRTLVPLTLPGPGVAASATYRHAAGSVGLTMPSSAVDLAVTLVHEFQHSKLSVMLDIAPLHRGRGVKCYYAPWRADPRPVGGLLQGVYAFVGVADVWRSLRARPELSDLATQRFADTRGQVHEALTTLEDSDELTARGARFASGLRATVDQMMAEPLPSAVVRSARQGLSRNHDAWRRRNHA